MNRAKSKSWRDSCRNCHSKTRRIVRIHLALMWNQFFKSTINTFKYFSRSQWEALVQSIVDNTKDLK